MTTGRGGGSGVRRCPACGQRLGGEAPPACPLCGFHFHDNRSTSDDTTVYAEAYSRETRGWWSMCRWVFFSSASRTKHLGLMRVSMASRHFARVNLALLSFGLAVFAFTEYGWYHARVMLMRPDGAPSIGPQGSGWFRLVAGPRDLVARHPTDVVVDLWWNPAQAIIAVGLGIGVGWLCLRALLFLIRRGVTLAHRRAYRRDLRMTAAIKYGTAWFVPLLVAGGVLMIRPLSYIGASTGWGWVPGDDSLLLLAGVLAGFGTAMWWFWFVRLGVGAPVDTRGSVTAFYAMGVPLLTCGAALAWRYLVEYTTSVVFQGLHLTF